METAFLIIHFYSMVVVMPEKYPKDQCELIGQSLKPRIYLCLPAPKASDVAQISVPQYDKDGRLKVYIDNMPKCLMNISSGKLECN